MGKELRRGRDLELIRDWYDLVVLFSNLVNTWRTLVG